MKTVLASLFLVLSSMGAHASEPLLLYAYGNLAQTSELVVYEDGKVILEERLRGESQPETTRLTTDELSQLQSLIGQYSELTARVVPYQGQPGEFFGGLVIRQGRRMHLVRSFEMSRRVLNGAPIAILLQQWVNERTQLDLPLQ